MSERSDFFAEIAAHRDRAKSGLFQRLAQPDPTNLLPLQAGSLFSWPEFSELNGKESLNALLESERVRTAGFLSEQAPPLEESRTRQQITTLEWKNEDFAPIASPAVLMKENEGWESISLPHVIGPIGKATCFYRSDFEIKELPAQKRVFFCCTSADYLAEIYINEVLVGIHEGFFSAFEFDITDALVQGKNRLLIRLKNDAILMGNTAYRQDQEGDKIYAATGLGWDDPELGWHHCPPGMALIGPLIIEQRNILHLNSCWVRTINLDGSVELNLEVSSSQVGGSLPVHFRLSLFGKNFLHKGFQSRMLEAPEPARKGPTTYRYRIEVDSPRVWTLDAPWLYEMQVELWNGEACQDTARVPFGIRTFRLDEDSVPRGTFFLNDEQIRLRGANTMGFEQWDVLRGDFDQLRDDILLAKICGMNFLRFTQRPVQREVYDYCSRLGLLTQTDLPLFAVIRRDRVPEILRQTAEMVRHIREYPCNALVSYINEPFPYIWGKAPERYGSREDLEGFIRAANEIVRLQHQDQVIKPIDGDYDPPGPGLPDNHCYTLWYNGHMIDFGRLHQGEWLAVKEGWNVACGEFGAEGLENLDFMFRHYPPAWLPSGPDDESWLPAAIPFAQTYEKHWFFFETPKTAQDWISRSQSYQAWATQLFTEALRRNSDMVSFAIHLFIDAWPAGWMKTIMDCERNPKPAFFAYRNALQANLPSIRMERWEYMSGESISCPVYLCRDLPHASQDARLHYRVEIEGGRVLYSGEVPVSSEPWSVVPVGRIEFVAPVVKDTTGLILRIHCTETGQQTTGNQVSFRVVPSLLEEPQVSFVSGVPDEPSLSSVSTEEATAVVAYFGTPGTFDWRGEKFAIEVIAGGPRHFVSIATGHPAVKGLHENALSFLQSHASNRIEPLCEVAFSEVPSGWQVVARVAVPVGERHLFHGGAWAFRPVLITRMVDGNCLVASTIELSQFKHHRSIRQMLANIFTCREPIE